MQKYWIWRIIVGSHIGVLIFGRKAISIFAQGGVGADGGVFSFF